MKGAEWVAEDRYQVARDASRFETWESAGALVLAMGPAARYANSVGLEAIRDRVRALAGRLREALGAIQEVRLPVRARELCRIVSLWVDGRGPRHLLLA